MREAERLGLLDVGDRDTEALAVARLGADLAPVSGAMTMPTSRMPAAAMASIP